MPEPKSPFDDDADDSPPPTKRQRRPWWRWNIITLAVVLFALAWIRELTGMPPSAVWTLVISIFMAWAVGPLLFVGSPLTSYAPPPDYQSTTAPAMEEPHNEFRQPLRSGRRDRRGRRGEPSLLLIALRRLSLVLMACGAAAFLFLLVMILAQAGQGRSSVMRGAPILSWLGMLGALATPLQVVVSSGVLYTLTVIAERVDWGPRER